VTTLAKMQITKVVFLLVEDLSIVKRQRSLVLVSNTGTVQKPNNKKQNLVLFSSSPYNSKWSK